MKTTKLISKVLPWAVLGVALSLTLPAKGAVIIVPSRGILTIQQGIDAAAAGDTVLVMPGTYTNPDVGKWWPPAVLVGSDKPGLKLKGVGSVKIVGSGLGRGIMIAADGVRLEGFDISGFDNGILVLSDTEGGRITGNRIHDSAPNGDGISVFGSIAWEIDHNTVERCYHGISLGGWPAANIGHQLHHNLVKNNTDTGILLFGAEACGIRHNEVENNGQDGMYVRLSPGCIVVHNRTDHNRWSGIGISGSAECQVISNEANNNGAWGVAVAGSCGSNFSHNSAEGNGEYDLFAPNWDNTEATCNTYSANRAGAALPSLSLWDAD